MTDDEKRMIYRLRNEGMSYAKISVQLGISENTVKSYCRRNDLGNAGQDGSDSAMPVEETVCMQCGKKLCRIPKQKPRKFCSEDCRRAWWKANNIDTPNRRAYYRLTCVCCGREFESYGNKDRKYCSHACYIKDRFKGGGAYDDRAV